MEIDGTATKKGTTHIFIYWLPLRSKSKTLSFIPYKWEVCVKASRNTSMSCFHLTPSHSDSSSLSTAFPALYKHFKTCFSFTHQVHSNARIGWGYQQEVSNPAPDGWESLAAPNSGGGREVTAWHGYKEIFFFPQHACLTICRAAKPYGMLSEETSSGEESREHHFRWWAGFLQEVFTSPSFASLALMLAVAEARGWWRKITGSSYMFLRLKKCQN